jgi:hypothetical protein
MHYPASTSRTEGAPSRRPRDLVISLLVLLVPVLVLVGGYQILAERDQPVPVAPDAEIAAAQRAGLEAVEPTGLDPQWVPVSAVFRQVDGGATLRLGYLTPQRAPVQVVQSSVTPERLLPQELVADPTPVGTVTAGGVTWQRYPGREGETALVRHESGHTVLVVGAAAEPELRELAAALR